MPEITAQLSTALADRYKIESHIGEGGMATRSIYELRVSISDFRCGHQLDRNSPLATPNSLF